MKIEKVNENQIRCTLTREDLADRQLKLSELAYGTEKAKMLFRDMMQQAAYECGFEAEDIPLMIEAIPLSADTIILIITKVEYPEELDTRFSQFAPGEPEDDIREDLAGQENDRVFETAGADDILDFFRKIQEEAKQAGSEDKKEKDFIPLEKAIKRELEKKEQVLVDITKLFVFDEPTSGLDPLMQAEFFKLIQEYTAEGATCLLSTHVLSEIKRYCKNAAIMKEGRLQCVEPVSNLTRTNAKRIQLTRQGRQENYIYKGDLRELMKELAEYEIEDILIEEPSLEEIFLHFYQQ